MHTLIDALVALDSKELAEDFLADLLSEKEIVELSQRWEVALELASGKSYVEVTELTGASSTTVSRVSKCLHGERAGYRRLIDKLDA